MARPIKDTVDYFPHFCDHGKTMFVIEQKYGNDGYAFWFKLLELLGKTEGHFIDYNNLDDWEFLQAKTKFSEVKCKEILDKLALLGAIDKFLWVEKHIVWSDNFMKNIADAYKNRKRPIPQKPSFLHVETSKINTVNEFLCVETPELGIIADISTAEKPHSRVEENRVDNNIENNSIHAREDKPVDNFSNGLNGTDGADNLYPEGNPLSEGSGRQDAGRPVTVELSAIRKDREFMTFWEVYPKKQAMDRAYEAWKVFIDSGGSVNDIVFAARKYTAKIKNDGTDSQFIKMPHNFLAEGIYTDYLPKHSIDCPDCHGSGWKEIEEDGRMVMAECGCRRKVSGT